MDREIAQESFVYLVNNKKRNAGMCTEVFFVFSPLVYLRFEYNIDLLKETI